MISAVISQIVALARGVRCASAWDRASSGMQVLIYKQSDTRNHLLLNHSIKCTCGVGHPAIEADVEIAAAIYSAKCLHRCLEHCHAFLAWSCFYQVPFLIDIDTNDRDLLGHR